MGCLGRHLAGIQESLDRSCPFRFLGSVGFATLSEEGYRKPIFVFGGMCVFSSIVLLCFAAVGLSTNPDTLMEFPWSHGLANFTEDNVTTVVGNMYIGLNGVVHDLVKTDDVSGEMHETVFESYFSGGTKCSRAFCTDCKAAASTCWQTVIIGLCVAIPTLMSDYTRSHSNEDSNFEKSVGFIGGIAGGLIDLYGLIVFAQDCSENLPTTDTRDGITKTLHWEIGIGLKCLIGATCLIILDGLLHLIVPSPPERHKPLSEDETFLEETKSLLDDTRKQLRSSGTTFQRTMSSLTGGMIPKPEEETAREEPAEEAAASAEADPEVGVLREEGKTAADEPAVDSEASAKAEEEGSSPSPL